MSLAQASRRACVVVTSALAVALAMAAGCKNEKSAVEKRAEEMAKSNAASASASASASSAPDPGEQKFAAALKLSRERFHAFMVVYQDVEKSSGAKADLDKLRPYFAPGADGDKLHTKVGGEAAFSGKQGVPTVEFEVQATDCDMKSSTCAAGMWEKESQRGKFVCWSYKLTFSLLDGQLFYKEKSIPTIVPCDQK